jgi:HAD superfamily hydrolase (TIGR01490 family)
MSKFAAFDIDGTLIRWQLYHALVDNLAKKELIKPADYQDLKNARMRWKNRTSENSFREYEIILIKVFEKSLQNLSTEDIEISVDEVINEYSDQVYTFTRNLINELKDSNYKLIAISGSHQELVSRISSKFGFDYCTGTVYERVSGNFSGIKKLGSVDKKSTLLELVKKHNLSLKDSYAVGDSKSDASMLEAVDNPIAFNPDKELYNIAVLNSWKIVLERKNVIYELVSRGEDYVLAKTN